MSIQLLSVIPPQLFDKLQSSHFPVVPHTTHLSSTKFITRFAFTSQTETTEPPPPPPPPPTRGGWRRTKSYLAREAAILQLKQSSDLTSSLQRSPLTLLLFGEFHVLLDCHRKILLMIHVLIYFNVHGAV